MYVQQFIQHAYYLKWIIFASQRRLIAKNLLFKSIGA